MSASERSKNRLCADGKVRGAGRKKIPTARCLTPDCEGTFGLPGKPGGRGLCASCHGSASLMVKRGKTTWAELEELGLAQPRFGNMVERALIARRKEAGALSKETNDRTDTG